VARRNFGDDVTFFAPSLKHFDTPDFPRDRACRVRAISVTGRDCELQCDHCRGLVLKGMTPASEPDGLPGAAAALSQQGAETLLVSGGSGRDGVVPLSGHIADMARIRSELGLRIMVHTGITDAALAEDLAAAGVDTALIDIPGDDATIARICHLRGVTTADYDRSLANLCAAGLRVVPHVVIGLHRGEVRGEHEAIRIIAGHAIDSLVLVGLRPLEGTPMAGVTPPGPEQMAGVFLFARMTLPGTAIMLGCERPGGRHKEETDILALEAGLNGIAFPADGVVARARELGLKPRFSGMCCGAPFDGPAAMRMSPGTRGHVSADGVSGGGC